MKLLIVSDTHNLHDNLIRIFEKETFDAVAFLGDVEHGEMTVRTELERTHPGCPIRFVRGNCDDFPGFDLNACVAYDGVKVFLTHGHRFHVAQGREALAKAASEEGCRYAFFGHLHIPILEETGGVVLFNPGSVSKPRNEGRLATYGVMEVRNGKVLILEHRYVRDLE